MKFLFFNHDGQDVSGVFSYCKILLSSHPDCLVLSLNEETTGIDKVWGHRFYRIPFEKSHDVHFIADAIVQIAYRFPQDPLVLLPNNGEIPFFACLQAIGTETDSSDQWRILSIIHSDHPGSYAMPLRHNRQIAKFIGVSKKITVHLRSVLSERQGDIHCLPYPVKTSPIHPQTPFDKTVPLRILYAGRLEENQKHVSRLPLVATKLSALDIPFTLDIYGEGEASGTLSQTLDELPFLVRNKVRQAGVVTAEEMHNIMPHYDILLLVSSYEGTPIVLLESMASGLCPVVMDIESGVPDLIINGMNGIIVPQGDTDGMAEAIGMLHHDRIRLDSMKIAAQKNIEDNYSVSTHLNHFNEILQACAAMPPPPSTRYISTLDVAAAEILNRLDCTYTTTIVIWGGGMYGRSVVDTCLAQEIPVCAIIDIDTKKQKRNYKGIAYLSPDRLIQLAATHILVCSIAFASEIRRQIQQLYEQADRPCPAIICLQENT